MERIDSLSIRDKIFWALFAFVALSSWSSYIVTNVLGLRSNVYELYFIPLIIYYRRDIFKTDSGKKLKMKLSHKAFNYIGFVFCCFIVGLIVCGFKEFSGFSGNLIIEHIMAYRFVIYSAFIICYFSQVNSINLKLLLYICFFSVLGDFVAILTIHSANYASTVNLIALSLIVIIPIVQNHIVISITNVLFAFVVAFRSSYRISIVVVFVAILFSLIYSAAIRKKMKSILLLLLAMTAFVYLFQNFDVIVKAFSDSFGMNYASYRRISYRLTEALHGGEIGRSEIYLERLQLCTSEVIPFGLYRRAVGEYGWYTDTPFVFILDAFGLIGGIPVLFLAIRKGVKICVLSLKKNLPCLGILAIMFPIYIVLFIFNGTFLFWTYVSCLSGIVLGYWFNPNVNQIE